MGIITNQGKGKSILISVGWICVAMITLTFITPLAVFFPIGIGIVLKHDYAAAKEGRMLMIGSIIGAIIGFSLALYVTLNIV